MSDEKRTVVYTFSNSFLREADGMFQWLRHYGLTPTWSQWKDGRIGIELPNSEVPILEELKRVHPSRFAYNTPNE